MTDNVTAALERAESDSTGDGSVYAILAVAEAINALTRVVETGLDDLTATIAKAVE